jgi:hypothetical protein
MFARSLPSNTETIDSFRRITYRSSAYAVIAYFLSAMLEKIMTIIGASIRGFSIDFSYNELKITSNSYSWDQEGVLLIYLLPFIIQVIVFIFLNINFYKLESTPRFRKIFLLWMMFFTAYRLLGIFPAHMWFKAGVYYALNWMYFGDKLIIAAGLISVVFFFIAGFRLLRGLVALNGNYHFHIRDMGVNNLIVATLIIPFCCVSLAAILFYLPEPPNEELIGLVIILLLVIFSFIRLRHLDPNWFSFKEIIEFHRHPVSLVFITLAGVIILRLILGAIPLIFLK